jgi:hypothetical protein
LTEVRELRFRCYVLSKGPRKVSPAWSEKVDWCNEHLPDLPIHLSEDKGMVYGKVLVDDWPEYVERWLEWRPRGLVISVAQPWNVGLDVKFPSNVVRYDGTNLEQVRDRLATIRKTAGD